MHGLKPLKDKKGKAVINAFIKIENGSNLISNNHGLINEENFTINLC